MSAHRKGNPSVVIKKAPADKTGFVLNVYQREDGTQFVGWPRSYEVARWERENVLTNVRCVVLVRIVKWKGSA